MNRIAVALCGVLMFSGCASQLSELAPGLHTTETYDQMMAKWVGQPMLDWRMRSGPPDETSDLPNGHKLYKYHYGEDHYVDKDGIIRPGGCTTWLETDEKETIVKWRWEGFCTPPAN